MKIGHISYFYWPIKGGQEVYIQNLLEALSKYGYKSSVYQPRKADSINVEHVVSVINPRWLEFLLDKLELWYWGWHIFTLLLKLTKRGRLKREDIIISHYAVHAPAVWKYKRKVIVLSHGIEWGLEESTLEIKRREKIAKKAFNRFVTVANDTEYLRYLGLNAKPGECFFQEVLPGKWFIPNCVDINIFRKREKLPEFKNRNIILVPRIINRDRGIDLAIKAYAIVIREKPKLELWIAGGPLEGSYYEYCVRLAERLGVGEKVHFMGSVKHDKMPSLYSSSLITVIPTVRREGTSLSALESMACGTATVSTNIGGLKDLPTVKADAEDRDLAEKIISTLRNVDEVSELQSKKVRDTFNYRNWECAWVKVLDSLRKS